MLSSSTSLLGAYVKGDGAALCKGHQKVGGSRLPCSLGVIMGEKLSKAMIQTVEAIVDKEGHVELLEGVHLPEARRALVTILEEGPRFIAGDAALLSEASLADDWDRPEEDEAWSHLQSQR